MNLFYCFMILLMMSICDASKLNTPSQELEVKKFLTRLNRKPIKSIESLDGDIIDCVHISHQPAFDHPLLKNHTIQMRPSYYPQGLFDNDTKNSKFRPNSKNVITKPISQLWHLNGSCPRGTIPIRRIKQEDIMRAGSINNFGKKKQKSFSQLPLDPASVNPSVHEYSYATVQNMKYYGTQATINVWNPQIQDPSEFSLAQIWIVGGPSSNRNTIEAGWQVYPKRYGDKNTRLFIYWTSDNYQSTGCYNLGCSGFVQTNNKMALGGSINAFSSYDGPQYEITILVWKDPKHGSWWLKYGDEIIGYWPTSLFQFLTESASVVHWGGEVLNYKLGGQHTTTQMGSGRFAEGGFGKASYFKNLEVVDESNTLRVPDVITPTAEQQSCYNILVQKNNDWGHHFFYGGPGRNANCP